MQITLNHTEIEKALIEYIANQGINLENSNTHVTMIAGRGSNGYTANIAIEASNGKKEVPPEETKAPLVEFNEDDDGVDDSSGEDSSDTLFGA